MTAASAHEVVLRVGPVSALVRRRWIAGSAALVLLVVALALVSLCYGSDWISPSGVARALAGSGDDVMVVREWRLPRTLAAVLFGAALAVSGALLQTLTRNPLGSPDILGLDAGAFTGVLIAYVFADGAASVAGGAIVGGLLAAGVMGVLAARGGFRGGRLIVVGIAMNAILTALDSWIVQRTDHDVASAASGWNAGSLNGVGMSDLALPAVIVAGCVVVLVPVAGAIQQSAMGDDVAAATGVHLGRLRLVLLVVTVALTATVTAVAGPIAFVALCAPQIGRRLVGASSVALWPAALTGAALLLLADIGAQWLLAPQSLPVGVMTTSFGGCYLLWFLIREVRSGRR